MLDLDSEEVDTAGTPDLVEALVPALSDSNPKFVQGALGLLIALVEVMGEELHHYIGNVWTPLVERLGDAKAANRDRAVDLAVALSTLVVAASTALERLKPGFEHKNWRARESTLLWFGRLLAQHALSARVCTCRVASRPDMGMGMCATCGVLAACWSVGGALLLTVRDQHGRPCTV